eukprot:TRINITY_DN509_c0_g1_i4.p1 TRINITY_DN509_c0_g1~~TRINITY_DN509_c0_g1_i4.p1  ORF type:complete len:352 (+),score=45.72 TRINITY_DN509_c0_g1_i4:146-1057(+)
MSFSTPDEIEVLMIDDEMVSRLVLERLLRKAGYLTITSVDSAFKALELLDAGNKYDLILADVKMPKMNGIELLQELNQRDMTDVPIIMVSSVEELQLVYQCLNLGASDFLTKPVRSETVTNLWQNVWRKRREQTALAMARQQARQIEKLEQEVEQAFTSPLEAITNQLLEVVGSSDVTDSAKDAMLAILKNVYEKTPGVYKPVLQDLVNNKRKIDSLTRSWLSRELYVADGAKPTSEADVVDLQPPTACALFSPTPRHICVLLHRTRSYQRANSPTAVLGVRRVDHLRSDAALLTHRGHVHGL